ncbi:hypothetical protein CTI12_AA325990 [Artemisia annua]|uniref:Uncharacterized protein n=1 Tax=Artemisia annua TaxID=35608 RepID=A0A2U1MYA6_ARTAN|nr:hypothetical protein CTI12_AA325990 [Artemisia annua]
MGKGELDLRVGDGSIIAADGVGTYKLPLRSGFVLELQKYYYVPILIQNIMHYELLSDSGFNFKSSPETISAFKHNVFYIKVISQYGLYMLDLRARGCVIVHINTKQPRYWLNNAKHNVWDALGVVLIIEFFHFLNV